MTEQSKIKIENLKSYGDPAESAGESGQSHQMTAGSELLAVSSKRQEKSRWLEELQIGLTIPQNVLARADRVIK